MIEEIGVITAVDKDHIWVETEVKTTCGSCEAQENCGTSVVAKAFSPKKEQLILRCSEEAEVGQRVKLGIQESHLVNASALIYVVPLIALIASALGAQAALPLLGLSNELWIIGFAFFTTFLCFRWIKSAMQVNTVQKFQPRLLAILPYERSELTSEPKI